MINKSVHEADLIYGMQHELQPKKATNNDLQQAVEYLNSAVEIFEEAGMTAKADQILKIVGKLALASEVKPSNPDLNVIDWIHTPVEQPTFNSNAEHAPQRRKPKNPTSISASHQMNPLEMALSDDSMADDLLDLDINDAEIELLNPDDKTFEDAD